MPHQRIPSHATNGLGWVLCVLLAGFLGPEGIATAQSPDNSEPDRPAHSRVQFKLIATYDVDRLNRITTTELVREGFCKEVSNEFTAARHSVKLYRVTYPSVIPEKHNRPTLASGLIAIPDQRLDSNPIISYQHGTVFTKTAVPSFPEESMETRLMVAQFAGQGYIVIAADFFGKGISDEGDSYLVKASTQQACVDMLFGARSVLTSLEIAPGPLFLSGWSQGGWATLVLLQHLESLDVPVKCAATASAPADVYTVMNRWINNPQPVDAVFLPGVVALQLAAQDHYLQRGLVDDAIKPAYVEACRDLYANRIDWPTFHRRTPSRVNEMLNEAFIKDSAMSETDYWLRLQAAHGYRWRSHTPLRCYYGEIDEVTPVYIARLPEGFHTITGGGPTSSHSAGPAADHRGTFLYAVRQQKIWFDEQLAESAKQSSNKPQ